MSSTGAAETNECKLLTAMQVAKIYGITRRTVWRWSAMGIIPKPKLIAPRFTRWDRDEVLEAIKDAPRAD